MAIGLRFCLPLHIRAGKEDVKSGPAVCKDTEDLSLWICGQCPFVQISLVGAKLPPLTASSSAGMRQKEKGYAFAILPTGTSKYCDATD